MPTDQSFLEGLMKLQAEATSRLEEAKADLSAIERTIAFYESIQPEPTPATVEEVRVATQEILAANGNPLHRKEIHERLNLRDIYLNGKDPVASLGAILSRFSEDFYPCGDGKWDLRERGESYSETLEAIVGDIEDLPW